MSEQRINERLRIWREVNELRKHRNAAYFLGADPDYVMYLDTRVALLESKLRVVAAA